jgi:hypothetical protein
MAIPLKNDATARPSRRRWFATLPVNDAPEDCPKAEWTCVWSHPQMPDDRPFTQDDGGFVEPWRGYEQAEGHALRSGVAELTVDRRAKPLPPSADGRGADAEDGRKRAHRASFVCQQHLSGVVVEGRPTPTPRRLAQQAIGTELQEPGAPQADCRGTNREPARNVVGYYAVGQQENDSASNNNPCSECASSRELLQSRPFRRRQNQQTMPPNVATNFCNTLTPVPRRMNVVCNEADNRRLHFWL